MMKLKDEDVGKERIKYLVLIMAVIILLTEGVTFAILYNVSFSQQERFLVESAKNQARIIESIIRFNALSLKDGDLGNKALPFLLQIIDSNENFVGFGKTGEFVLAKLEDNKVRFLLSHRHDDPFGTQEMHPPVPLGSAYAVPMQKVLVGGAGSMIAPDYRGELVLAAFEPVNTETLKAGIVAKIDMTELRAPFIDAAMITFCISFFLIVAGALFFLRVSNPLLRRIMESETRFRSAFEDAATGMALSDVEGRILKVNEALCRILGYSEEELLAKNFKDVTKPGDIDKNIELRKLAEKGELNTFQMEKDYIHKSGSIVNALLHASLIRDSKGVPLYYVAHVIDLTQRKFLERELESLARFPAENPYPVIRISNQGKILYANKSSSLILADWDCGVGDTVPKEWQDLLLETYQSGVSRGLDKHFFDRILSITIVPVPGVHYLNIYGHDITDRKHAEDKYLDLYNNAPDMYFSVDAVTGKITECNNTLSEKTGYSRDSILGMHLSELYSPEIKEYSEETFREFLERGEIKGREMSVLNKDGSTMYVALSASAVRDEKGNIVRSRSAWSDITEKRKASEALKRANDEVKAFANIVSHDLRSPLTNIRGFSKTLHKSCMTIGSLLKQADITIQDDELKRLNTLLCDDIPNSLDYIDSSVTAMDRLVTRILVLSRIGMLTISPIKLNMNELVKNLLKVRNHQVTSEKIEVVTGDLPEVTADFLAMDQIVGNILSNAINYLDKNRPGKIIITGVRRKEDTLFSIQDNGIGIPEKEKHKVFEIFRRGSNVGESSGEGMGMTYVKALVEKHGGEIFFESEEKFGTTFYFSIPHMIESSHGK